MNLRMLLLPVVLFACGPALAEEKVGDDRIVPVDPKPGVYPCGAFTYTLLELPRAEGKPLLVGSLAKEGAPVAGGEYYRLELPIGSFIWYPPIADSAEVGWIRIGPKKYSRWSMAILDEKKNAQGQWVTRMRDPLPAAPPNPRPAAPPAVHINQ